ncbi:MAG: Ribokinase [Alphaproteobacteria bacterium]|jgi:ribokinase|nr:Ribokinase [Alphaproteobacteria bacterium]
MIVVFGSIIVDHLFAVPVLPRRGETVLGERYSIMPGGKGANQAMAAARDGAAVQLVGAVGSDHLAVLALEGVRDAGVGLTGIRHLDLPTGAASVGISPEGDNQIMVAAGANLAASADWLDGRLSGDTTLVLQRELAQAETERAIFKAKAARCRVVLNLAPALPLASEALCAADVLVVNEIEAAALAQTLRLSAGDARALSEALTVSVVVTLGEQGAQSCDGDRLWRTPALKVDVADTTGAGDAFVGVLAAALDRGLPFAQAIRRGCVAGSLSCRATGAQAALPDSAAIEAGMAQLAPDSAEP